MLSKLFKNRKGFSLGQAPALVMSLVIIGVFGAIGLLVMSNISNSGGFTGAAANALANATLAISNFFSMMPTVGTIFIAVILLGAVTMLGVNYARNR